MSFDVYLMTGDTETKFDRSIVERAFAHLTDETESDVWRLHYADGDPSNMEVWIDAESFI